MHCAAVMTQGVLLPVLLHLCRLPARLLLAGDSSQMISTDPHGSMEIKPWMLHPLNSQGCTSLQGEHSVFIIQMDAVSAFGP